MSQSSGQFTFTEPKLHANPCYMPYVFHLILENCLATSEATSLRSGILATWIPIWTLPLPSASC